MMGQGDHIPALDGLRGIAIGTVMLSHYSNHTNLFGKLLGQGAGQIGVMLFFVLSGFLMARLYFDKPISVGAIGRFYRRRIARIVPLFLFVAATGLIYYLLTGSELPGVSVTTSNVWQNLLFLEGSGVLWTIAVEMQFYLLFPIIWVGYRFVGAWIAAPLIAAMGWRANLGGADLFPVLYFGQFFCAGIVTEILYRKLHNRSWPRWAFPAAALVYFLALPRVRSVLTPFDISGMHHWWAMEYYLIIPALLLGAILSPWGRAMLSIRPARWLGEVSYSAYLWHGPVLAAVVASPVAEIHILALPAFALATAACAQASLLAIEKPARDFINGVKMWRQSTILT